MFTPTSTVSRRSVLSGLAAVVVAGPVRLKAAPLRVGDGGRQFAMMGDSTSRFPRRGVQKDNLLALAGALGRLEPQPEFLLYRGDRFWGYTEDERDLRAQWQEWLDLTRAFGELPVHTLTGNHTCYDAMSAGVFREMLAPRLAKGTEAAPDGLLFVWRDGDLLLVMANTSFQAAGPEGRVDWRWVDAALERHAGARFKFVAGHFPVFSVNGYNQPCWRLWEPDAGRLWQTLVQHRVSAYLCAHIPAFDVQIHEGIPQICAAGGGFPLMYPPQTEYLHAARIAVDSSGLAWQTIDREGAVRERGAWPFECPPVAEWPAAEAKGQALAQLPQGQAVVSEDRRSLLARSDVLLLHFEGSGTPTSTDEQTLLNGWTDATTPDAVWIGLQGTRLEVRLSAERGAAPLAWRGKAMGERFAFDLALHGALGPGGVLFRAAERDPWTSLTAMASTGFTPLDWPVRWSVGLGRASYTRAGVEPVIAERVDPFLGSSLQVRARLITPKAL